MSEDRQPGLISAGAWANALDAHMRESGQSAATIISQGYADGQILGVLLDRNHPQADDERAVIASEDGWVVRYDPQAAWWTVVDEGTKPYLKTDAPLTPAQEAVRAQCLARAEDVLAEIVGNMRGDGRLEAMSESERRSVLALEEQQNRRDKAR